MCVYIWWEVPTVNAQFAIRTLPHFCLMWPSSLYEFTSIRDDILSSKFPEPKSLFASGALLSWDTTVEQSLVFMLFYGDQRKHYILSCDNWQHLTNRRKNHRHMALLWRLCDSDAGYKTADLLTYILQICPAFYLHLDPPHSVVIQQL